MSKKQRQWFLLIMGLFFLLLVTGLIAIAVGATKIPFQEIISFFRKADFSNVSHNIIFNIRLPRILLGFAIGGALSIAGVILQGMFRNPLVEPYTLGISGGAALGVCLNLAFKWNNVLGIIAIPLAGLLGAGFVILGVYFLSMRRGVLKMQCLLLSGVMVSFICSSLFMLIMAVMKVEDLHGIIFWTMGSLEQPSWLLIKIMLIVSCLGLLITYFFAKDLNAFSLGQEEALRLGINTERVKKILFFLTSLLTGVSVAIAGIIGFIGLVVPHFIRIVCGSDHRIVIIASFLAGGIFLIASDAVARTIISPLELPVGVITGIIGGIIFIIALNSERMGK